MVIYMYITPEQPLEAISFLNHKKVHLPIYCKFCPNNFPRFKCVGNLSLPCCKKCQCYPRVMIYTNFVELNCLMLHAKFQNYRPSGSGGEDSYMFFAIYSHCSHLGHVTLTIYMNFFPLPKDDPHEVWLRLAKRFQRRRCSILWKYTCI